MEKTKQMNNLTPPAPALDWPTVEAAIGSEQTQILRRHNVQRKRWKSAANGVLIGAGILLALILLIGILAAIGCTTDQQRTAYTTLASSELAAKSSYDGYLDSVLSGQSRTNEVPLVSAAFNEFQAAMTIAVSAASGNTNALVTAGVAEASAKLFNLINSAKGKK